MTDRTPPRVDNAPGLAWKARVRGWEARWQARTDLVKLGYTPKSIRLWAGETPTEIQADFISDLCNRLQAEMLVWGHGGIQPTATFDGTLRGLVAVYQTDRDSSYRKLRHKTRQNYDSCLRRIETTHGSVPLTEIRARLLRRWHEDWAAGGKLYMGHGMIGLLRTLFGFGATLLEDEQCVRLSTIMHNMKFPMGKPRGQIITPDQVVDLRRSARGLGYHALALAQAIQFEIMLRQKDVIGEWVPMTEPGVSYIIDGNEKWLRGLRWSEIDADLILSHVTSKRQKEIVVDLKLAPMVMEELTLTYPDLVVEDMVSKKVTVNRSLLPASGAIITDGVLPYNAAKFRRYWRTAARAAGIPDDVYNMDSRAGAITEATDIEGMSLEHVRHAATHSDTKMTQRYSRGSRAKVDNVMQLRAKSRKP